MKAFVEFFLNRPLLVRIIFLLIMVLTVRSVLETNQSAFPEVDLSKLIIVTEYPGASPKDVEQNVTRVIEKELKGITGVTEYTSTSSENVSIIVVDIDMDHPDPKAVKDEIMRAVDRVNDLPDDIKSRPFIHEVNSAQIPVLEIGITGDVPFNILRQTAKIIERDLETISDISKIEMYGFRDRQFQVNLDPNKVAENYVALNDIIYALKNRNVRSTGGNLESYKTQRNILTLSEFDNADQVKEVIIRSNFAGENLRIKDIGEVEEGFEEEDMRPIIFGKQGISIVVKKTHDADIIKLVNRLQSYLYKKQKTVPTGVKLTAINDMSIKVRNRVNVVISNGIFGFLLLIAVLVFFIDIRSAFWIAMSIPSSLGITFIILPLLNIDFNLISMVGMILVMGMLVDNSIVVSDNVLRHRTRRRSAHDAALLGIVEVGRPVIGTVLTTLCSFVPMMAITGIIGRFTRQIPLVVILALSASLFECFILLPSHLKLSISNYRYSNNTWREKIFALMNIPYKSSLKFLLKFRYVVIVLIFALLIFSLSRAYHSINFDLYPADAATALNIYIEMEDGSTFDATEDVVHQMESVIQTLPKNEIKDYSALIGTDQSDPLSKRIGNQPHLAFVKVNLSTFTERNRMAQEILDDIRPKAVTVTGAKDIRFEIEKTGLPMGKPIELHVHADNDEDREYFVSRIIEDLKKMDGVSDITTSSKIGRDEYKLEINYEQLAALGLTVNDVASTLRIAFDGVNVTSVVKNNDEITIRVRFPKQYRQNINNVLDLPIRNKEAKLIPIKSFATLSNIRADTTIHHTNGHLTTTIYGETDKTKILPKKAIQTIINKYSPELPSHPGVSFTYGGEVEKNDESIRSLLIAFMGGLLSIYLILALLFNSPSQPLLILVAIPLGLIGVIWAFYLHQRPFSFMGIIGVVGLSGVVVNNSLVMLDFINYLVGKKMRENVTKSREILNEVIDGAARRLKPIFLTTVTTVAGLLPLAYGVGGSDPLVEPMVLAMGWGLIASTFLTLYIVPSLYLINKDFVFFFRFILRKLGQEEKRKKKEYIDKSREDHFTRDFNDVNETTQKIYIHRSTWTLLTNSLFTCMHVSVLFLALQSLLFKLPPSLNLVTLTAMLESEGTLILLILSVSALLALLGSFKVYFNWSQYTKGYYSWVIQFLACGAYTIIGCLFYWNINLHSFFMGLLSELIHRMLSMV